VIAHTQQEKKWLISLELRHEVQAGKGAFIFIYLLTTSKLHGRAYHQKNTPPYFTPKPMSSP
jgi:hypothetical protein